ncbi:MAG TPA: Gfo/Idh/MocA family oxidoreductase [Candidatus Acidoferrales bacterium]|nr:Gfo/Idh/MocA family oxidoreductase [Candidatus Acidoferrales bacterium]
MTGRVRVAVVGAGDFGRHHARVYSGLEGAELAGVLDTNRARAEAVAREFGAEPLSDLESVARRAQAASVAVPTADHAAVATWLLERGVDVLVEKPIASSVGQASQIIEAAERRGRILQAGHVERFNPALEAAARIASGPLFFEVHRLGVFTPRSLDVDVVYDVMIHDLDILLALAGTVSEVKAVGIPVVTDKVDIAHARLEFDTGAVANVTASRISTERVRKLRFFQRHEYISVDYARRDALRIRAAEPGPPPRFEFEQLPVEDEEPLRAELRAFLEAVRTRRTPVVDGRAGRDALVLADRVMAAIAEHARAVRAGAPEGQAAR